MSPYRAGCRMKVKPEIAPAQAGTSAVKLLLGCKATRKAGKGSVQVVLKKLPLPTQRCGQPEQPNCKRGDGRTIHKECFGAARAVWRKDNRKPQAEWMAVREIARQQATGFSKRPMFTRLRGMVSSAKWEKRRLAPVPAFYRDTTRGKGLNKRETIEIAEPTQSA